MMKSIETMKKAFVICIALAVAAAMTVMPAAADIFSIKTSLSPNEPVKSLSISVKGGEALEIGAEDIEIRLGVERGSLKGMTFISVPKPGDGVFLLDGVEIGAFEYLSRAEIDRLCFIASEDVTAVSAEFMPEGGGEASASLTIHVMSSLKSPPAIEGASYDTMKNVRVNGYINANDPEEDSVGIQLVKKPVKGDVSFNGKNFVYEPFTNMVGTDYFTVCAYDSYGNYSAEAAIEIVIENSRAVFSYEDMKTNPSNYAALKLQEKGVMTGRQIGGEWYFNPEDQVNRGDFLIMLLAAAGMETKPAVNTGLPNDAALPYWLKPYVKKAIDEKIISREQPFNYYEIPIRAEAVQMTDRAAKISDVKQFALSMSDAADIPDWALQAYRELAAYKMLDLYDGKAHPVRALTNSYAADLIWQLYKHCNR